MGLYQKSNFMSFRLNPPAGGGMPESPNFMIKEIPGQATVGSARGARNDSSV